MMAMRLQLSRWGALTSLGDTEAGFARLCEGASGLVPAMGAEIAWLSAAEGVERVGPVAPVRFAIEAPRGVGLADAALGGAIFDPEGLAVIVATTAGAMVEGEPVVGEYVRGEPLSTPRAFFWDARLHNVADALAEKLGATGPAFAVSTACTSGTVAVGIAADLLRAGRARRVLVVGSDALCRSTLFGFRSLGIYAPERCRPFDVARQGMNIGEAAAWVLVERLDAGAGPGAIELLGVGVATDAQHLTAPDPAGKGLGRAIRAALGPVDPHEVDHVNAHGTGTQPNDAAEATLLPGLLPNALVSATKGATGHTLGAAGVVELVLLIQSLRTGVIPPVVGLTQPIHGVAVSSVLRRHVQRVGVSTNLAFGGHNAAVAIRRLE